MPEDLEHGRPAWPSSELRYMPHLDSLRALAVFGVLVEHFWRPSFAVVPLGHVGVRLFFVLSGYLITRILLQSRESIDAGRVTLSRAVKSFYLRRVLRLVPGFYTVLLLVAMLDVLHARQTLPWHASYLTNVYVTFKANPWPLSPYWSLAVEEQFYLVWPCLIFLLPLRWIPRLLIGLCVAGPAFRLVIGAWATSANWAVYLPPISMETSTSYSWGAWLLPGAVDALGLGALLAWYSAHRPQVLTARASFPSIAGVTGAVLFAVTMICRVKGIAPWAVETGLPLAVALLSVAAVYRGSRGLGGVARTIMGADPLVYLGKISYGIYLWHSYFVGWAGPILSLLPWAVIRVGIVPTAIGAGFTWWFARATGRSRLVGPSSALTSCAVALLAVAAARSFGLVSPFQSEEFFLFVVRCSGAVLAAVLSWELLERPINGMKRRLE